MLAAPTTPFDVPTWGVARVHPDHHVQVARALYSVPTRYIGQQVRVRADRTMVRIYVGTSKGVVGAASMCGLSSHSNTSRGTRRVVPCTRPPASSRDHRAA